MTKHTGSCHCGAIRFEVELDLADGATKCNCSICTKLGPIGKLVNPAAFRLVVGTEAELGAYAWGAKVSTRFFCRTCGVYCYGRGHLAELGGDFLSVNLNTLDGVEIAEIPLAYWDGRHDNWQAGPRATPFPIARGAEVAA